MLVQPPPRRQPSSAPPRPAPSLCFPSLSSLVPALCAPRRRAASSKACAHFVTLGFPLSTPVRLEYSPALCCENQNAPSPPAASPLHTPRALPTGPALCPGRSGEPSACPRSNAPVPLFPKLPCRCLCPGGPCLCCPRAGPIYGRSGVGCRVLRWRLWCLASQLCTPGS